MSAKLFRVQCVKKKLLIGNWKLGHWWLVEKLNKYILCSEDVERALFSAHSSTCLLAQVVKDVSAQMGRPRHGHSYLPFRLSAPVHELSSGNRKWTAQSTCHPGHHNPAPTLLNWRLLFGDILVFCYFPPKSGTEFGCSHGSAECLAGRQVVPSRERHPVSWSTAAGTGKPPWGRNGRLLRIAWMLCNQCFSYTA